MNPRTLVHALEPQWQAVLDEVLRPRRVATSDVAKLAPRVEQLSRAYNAADAEGRRTRLPLEARIAFSFPRDVPKGAAAARELVATGVLALPTDRPLRVLDLGAGLGAMTWGLVRALTAAGGAGRVDATLVDEDAEALDAARAIAQAAGATLDASAVALQVTTRVARVGSAAELRAIGGGRHDVVIFGQVLSELDPHGDPGARLEQHVSLLEEALANLVADDGALVVVEPALRERTRHLHAVRDRMLERGKATVFAPCLHDARCPMLTIETDWCHEDLAVDLPAWTAPLARAAGLRWQGLTFSYLVLRKDRRRPVAALPSAHAVRFRVVSDPLRSKGKVELFICGEDGARRRIRQLDREVDEAHGQLGNVSRGDIVGMIAAEPGEEAIDERGRARPGAHVAIDVSTPRQ